MADLIPAPRPVPTREDRLADARTFRTWMSDTDREQLDARAATAEQERDEALDDRDAYREARDVLRKQLDTARADTHHDIARQLDILAADPGILRDWLTTCDPMPTSFGELFHALAEKLRRDDTPDLGSPSPRAQDEPARKMLPSGQTCRCGCLSEYHTSAGRCCGDFFACTCREFAPAEREG